MRHIWDAHIPMDDGVYLSADVYLPDKIGAHPIIVIGTPYDNTMKSHVDMASFFVARDYGFIVYDVRGRYDSEGEFYPFFNEGPDGYNVIEWAASQDWCNGKLGMMGGSYRGWIQWATAKEKPPHLVTMIPTATGGNWLQEFPFFNGVPCLWMFGWLNFVGARTNQSTAGTTADWEKIYRSLPIADLPEVLGRRLPVWKEWMSHPDLDEFWKRIRFTGEDFKRIDIPILHITGYYDGDQPGALHFYEGAVTYGQNPNKQYLIIGPWDHPGTRIPKRQLGGFDFGDRALMEMKQIHLEWFDYWLKGKDNNVKSWPLTMYFLINENKWIESDKHWPVSSGKRALYLRSSGRANTIYGDGELLDKPASDLKDEYVYNPENPAMPTNNFDFYGSPDEVPLDRRYLLRRDDHLVYTSLDLKDQLKIAGSPITELYVSSDCPDTDFFTTLMNVYPDGRSILVSHGLIRARYRDSLETPELMKPGEIYKIVIKMDSIGVQFQPKHKIRLCITSSEFPRYARNQNTGNQIDSDVTIRIAKNTVYHGASYSSRLLLPIT